MRKGPLISTLLLTYAKWIFNKVFISFRPKEDYAFLLGARALILSPSSSTLSASQKRRGRGNFSTSTMRMGGMMMMLTVVKELLKEDGGQGG